MSVKPTIRFTLLTLALVLLWAGAGRGASDSIGVSKASCLASNLACEDVVVMYFDRVSSTPRKTVPASTGTLDSIRACVLVNNDEVASSKTIQFRAAVYKGNALVYDPLRIDTTQHKTFTVGAFSTLDTVINLPFVGNATVMQDSTYWLCIEAKNVTGATAVYVHYTTTSNDTLITSALPYANAWTSSITGTLTNNRELSLQAFFTKAAATTLPKRRRQILEKGIGDLMKDYEPYKYLWPKYTLERFAGALWEDRDK